MSRILIDSAGWVATCDDVKAVVTDASIVCEDGVIAEVLPTRPHGFFDEVIDGRGMLVTPGFVNTHHHLYQTLTRAVPAVQNAELFPWLTTLYDIWRGLTPAMIHDSAAAGIAELLLSGCTTVADHFYVYPQDQPGTLLDATIEAARTLGVRFHPTRGSMSRSRRDGGLPPDDVVQDERVILEDSARVIAHYHDAERFSMLRVGLAPCSPFSVTPHLLVETAALARRHGVRLHTHLAETQDETDYCETTHGMRPLAFAQSVGWVGPDVWFAHGVHFSVIEVDVLAATGTGVAHCPTSNLRLGSGIAPVPAMHARHVPVGLGVDGSASNDGSNMLEEIRRCTLVHRVGTAVDAMPPHDALWLATRGGARVLGRDDIGAVAPGMAADLALFDMRDLGYAGALRDPVGALLLCAGPSRASAVVVNGEIVVRDGQLQTMAVEPLIGRMHDHAAALDARAASAVLA